MEEGTRERSGELGLAVHRRGGGQVSPVLNALASLCTVWSTSRVGTAPGRSAHAPTGPHAICMPRHAGLNALEPNPSGIMATKHGTPSHYATTRPRAPLPHQPTPVCCPPGASGTSPSTSLATRDPHHHNSLSRALALAIVACTQPPWSQLHH